MAEENPAAEEAEAPKKKKKLNIPLLYIILALNVVGIGAGVYLV